MPLLIPLVVFNVVMHIAGFGRVGDPTEVRVIIGIVNLLWLIVFPVWNSGYRQGTTGQSIGRQATKTKLVKIGTGEPIGFGMALLRLIYLTVTLGIGYLWLLWEPKRQTVADKIVKAVVVRIDDTTT